MLKKRPAGRDVNDDDVFIFNDAFDDPRAKVHINSIQVKETVSGSVCPFRYASLSILLPLRPPPSSVARGVAAHAECGRGRPEALPRRGDCASNEGKKTTYV